MDLKKAAMWVIFILVAAYLLNIDIAALLQSIIHAAQQVHNSNAH